MFSDNIFNLFYACFKLKYLILQYPLVVTTELLNLFMVMFRHLQHLVNIKENINELNRKMNGKEDTVNTAQREDARERKRQRIRKQAITFVTTTLLGKQFSAI